MGAKINISEKDDKKFFENHLDRATENGEKLGLKINKKSKIVIRYLALYAAIATFGAVLFIRSLLKSSFNKNK